MTKWLLKYDFPATEPLDVPQPVTALDSVVTFWHHYEQSTGARPPADALGRLLRWLHDLPPAPVDLPRYAPLRTLIDEATASARLQPETRDWLLGRSAELLEAYARLDLELAPGHIHGDAYPGNLLQTQQGPILGDWDESAIGPRELDLVNTYQGVRFGRSADELERFNKAYGFDPREWTGFSTLRDMRELHTLGAFIRRSERGDEAASRQLDHRVRSLRSGSADLWAPET